MRTLHLISHTHWDREWHQTFQQFRLRLVQLVDRLLDILERDTSYLHFMLDGQTIVLEDYLQIRPEREAQLRTLVQQGRILIGPWYLMPDEFLVSPEAMIRNFLAGDRIARRFGPKMMVGYTPDPFGHIGQLPQILRGFGIDTACLWRGVADQPNEFWWQAPDGSRVLMGYLRMGYGNAAGLLGSGLDAVIPNVRALRDQLASHTDGADLLLMHGVDHQEAHPDTAAAVALAAGKLDGDRLIHSTLPAYFDSVKAKLNLQQLPVVAGELRSSRYAPLLPGVLSTRMWIKQRNDTCQRLLETWAEPWSSWAQVYAGQALAAAGQRHPEAALREAWRLLLQCQPHDSICGCSIDQVHAEMRPRFDQSEQIGEEITRQSLDALAHAVMSRPPTSLQTATVALVVFNPTQATRTDHVSVVIEAPAESGAFELLDEHGARVACERDLIDSPDMFNLSMNREELLNLFGMFVAGTAQLFKLQGFALQREGHEVAIELRASQTGEPNAEAMERAVREIGAQLQDPAATSYRLVVRPVPSYQVLLAASDVPGLGYRTFWVAPTQEPAGDPAPAHAIDDPQIENEFFIVTAEPDGSLDVLDKRSGVRYRDQNRFVDSGDRGDTYNYSPPEHDWVVSARLTSLLIERGAVQHTLELELEIEAPEALEADRKGRSPKTVVLPLTSRVTLTAGVARIDIHTEIDNRARDHRLRVHFAAPCAPSLADYDGHFEVVRRPVGVPVADATWSEQPRPEVPQRAFTAIADGQTGLLIANRGLPEVEVFRRPDGNGEIALTLLRCVGWLSRDDLPERKGPAGPGLPTPGAQMPGVWSFDYAIVPFQEAGRLEAYGQAYAFGAPLRAAITAPQAGPLPAQGSFMRVEPPEFVISAVKLAEDGRGWLARGYNLSGQPMSVTLTPPQPALAERVNLAEERLGDVAVAETGAARLDVGAYEIASVLFRLPAEG